MNGAMGEQVDEQRPRYRPGDRADFDRLYRDSYHRILYTLVAILRDQQSAEDCAQETFAKAFRSWHRWTPEAPAEAWLHRIALNTAFSHQRAEQRRNQHAQRVVGNPLPDVDPLSLTDMIVALRQLPAQDAALIVMRHLHGYSNRELAVVLGLPESTVSSRLAAAKRRLEEELRTDDLVTEAG